MKLHDYQLQTFSKWITFIPTIEVHIDNPAYRKKNIALILNIFIWHFRWLFVKESEDEEQIKVGTKVRTIKDKDFAGEEVFPVGTIGIVEEIREGENLPYIIRANLDFWYYSRDMFEVIED